MIQVILIFSMLLFGKEREMRGTSKEVAVIQEFLRQLMEVKTGRKYQHLIPVFQLAKELVE